MNTLPPGGSVYTVLLVSVQFSEKWIHIDLCYKGIQTNKPTHALSVSNSCWIEWTLTKTNSHNRNHINYFTFPSITTETKPPLNSQIFLFKVLTLQQKHFWRVSRSYMSLTAQILQNSGLGDKGTGLTPEQDIILRAAPFIGLAVQPGHGTPGPSSWLCHMAAGWE